jgi:hypothetical protein
MNREGAETYLRLLAEDELRDPALPRSPASGGAPLVTMSVALSRAAWTLTAIGALDPEIAEAILADADLALAARQRPEPPQPTLLALAGQATPSGSPRRFSGARLTVRPRQRTPRAGAAAPAEPAGGPDRYVPVGLMILFHDETISGELDLMSYAHTASGARLVATWHTRDPLGSRRHGPPPVEDFIVRDDRGHDYELLFDPKGRPESTCDLTLRPDPPPDLRWLEVTAPGERAVRVDLNRQDGTPAPEVSDLGLSVGEHLLNRIAERVLLAAAEFPAQPVAVARASMAEGLGAVIAALRAAEVLFPGQPGAGPTGRAVREPAGPRARDHRGARPGAARTVAQPALPLPSQEARHRSGRGWLRRRGRRAAGTGRLQAGPARPAQLRRGHLGECAGPGPAAGPAARTAGPEHGLPAVGLGPRRRRALARRAALGLAPGGRRSHAHAAADAAVDPLLNLDRGTGRRPVG